MTGRNILVREAVIAKRAERYDDMAAAMKKFVQDGNNKLTVTERILLSAAYKGSAGTRRSAWRIVSSIETESVEVQDLSVARSYRGRIEKELFHYCDEVLSLLDYHLLPNSKTEAGDDSTNESFIFYLKMKGDFLRYEAEVSSGEAKSSISTSSLEVYQRAMRLSEEGLIPTNPVRLDVALSLSLFYYEIYSHVDRAIEVARKAFQAAMADLGEVKEEDFKEGSSTLQQLRDNLTLWTS